MEGLDVVRKMEVRNPVRGLSLSDNVRSVLAHANVPPPPLFCLE
jgi:hypothetical protein